MKKMLLLSTAIGLLLSVYVQAAVVTLIDPNSTGVNGNGGFLNWDGRINYAADIGQSGLLNDDPPGETLCWKLRPLNNHFSIENGDYWPEWSYDGPETSKLVVNAMNDARGILCSQQFTRFVVEDSSNPSDPNNVHFDFWYFTRTTDDVSRFNLIRWELVTCDETEALTMGAGQVHASGEILTDTAAAHNNFTHVEVATQIPAGVRDIRIRFWMGRAPTGGAGQQMIFDAVTLKVEGYFADVDWRHPDTISGGHTLLGPGLGNGGFEDTSADVENHPSNDPPFRVWTEAGTPFADASAAGWSWHCNAANGGIQSNITNDGQPYASFTPYAGHRGFVLNSGANMDLASTTDIDVSGVTDIAVEMYMAGRDLGGTCTVAVSADLDGTVYPLGEIQAGSSGGVYAKKSLNVPLPVAAATMRLLMNIACTGGQFWIENVAVRTYPYQAVSEAGGQAVFDIALLEDPQGPADIDVVLTSYDWFDLTKVELEPAQLSFDSSNWQTPQQVTLTAIDNDMIDLDRDYVIGFESAADVNMTDDYLKVTVIDDDKPVVYLTDAEDVVVGEGGVGPGESATFIVALGGHPTADVQVAIEDLADPDQVTIDPAVLVFTPADVEAGTALPVTVYAINDEPTEAMVHGTTLRLTGTSEHAAFQANMPVVEVGVSILEDDCGAAGFEHDPMDANGDCVVNLDDLATLAAKWLNCNIPNDPGCTL